MFDCITHDDYSNSAICAFNNETIQICFESNIESHYNGFILTDNGNYKAY